MENTGGVLFRDDRQQWYVAFGDRWLGPLSAADVYQKIEAQEISWAHYVWRAGQSDWKRLCDVPEFQVVAPREPSREVQVEVKKVAKPSIKKAIPRSSESAPQQKKEWFLHYNDTQYGPFTVDEVDGFLRIGKLHGNVFAWKNGMPTWERLEKIGLFDQAIEASHQSRARRKPDLRHNPRSPLVAKIIVANQESVIVGVCRDISMGGMQVLTDRIPGSAGSKIKMNVSPTGVSEGYAIEPFVAEGVIVRVLEDQRGFSFRFDRLTEGARRSIETYIRSIS